MTLSELEKLRKKTKSLLMINIAIFVAAALFGISALGIVLAIIGVLMFILVVYKKMTDYKAAFKSNIVKASLSDTFSALIYEPEQGVSLQEVEDSALIQLQDDFASNDLIQANYGRVKFRQADVVITEHIRHVGKSGMTNEDTQTHFTGRFLVFDFLKQPELPVVVMGKSFSPDGFNQGVIGAVKSRFTASQNQIFMESEQFNNSFNVFSANAQSAFYILTPQIVEAITMLSNQYQGKIALCFREKKMYVAISSKKDALEANLLANHTIWQQQQLVLKDIKVITDFINLMNLENNALVTASY